MLSRGWYLSGVDLQVRSRKGGDIPSLTWAALIACHMTSPAVEAGVVDLSSLALLLLLPTFVFVVVASSSVWDDGGARSRTRIRRGVGIGVGRIVDVRGHLAEWVGHPRSLEGEVQGESVSQNEAERNPESLTFASNAI